MTTKDQLPSVVDVGVGPTRSRPPSSSSTPAVGDRSGANARDPTLLETVLDVLHGRRQRSGCAYAIDHGSRHTWFRLAASRHVTRSQVFVVVRHDPITTELEFVADASPRPGQGASDASAWVRA